MMHMASQDSNTYVLNPYFLGFVRPLTNLVFLFMTISAFGMCCGYFERVISGKINFADFYRKRYLRILPFFVILVLVDLVMGFSKESVYEAITNMTLLYGFFPHNISVIGVGWFLGVVFAFYIVFPFFCVLIENKKRAWVSFTISLIMNYILATYFDVGRTNIVYCLCYFILGGLIYQYRDELYRFSKNKKVLSVIVMIAVIVIYYWIGANTITMLLASGSMLIFALGKSGGVLQNRATKFISSVSMEVYLSHMAIFRVIEKLKLNRIFGNGLVQYFLTVVLVFGGTIVFSVILKRVLEIVEKKLSL